MLTELSVENWKSVKAATLHIDPLTVLIGANSSGKSNLLDAFAFLNRLSSGLMLTSSLQGDGVNAPLRGGIEWAARKPGWKFAVGATLRSDEGQDFEYRIECTTRQSRCEIISEQLIRVKYRLNSDGIRGKTSGKIKLYATDHVDSDSPTIVARLYNEKGGTPRQLGRSNAIIFQLVGQKIRPEIQDGVDQMISALRQIFILDPIPSHMRGFAPLSDRFEQDGSNMAGVIAALNERDKTRVEKTLTEYVSKLPEKDISRVFAETVGRFNSDAMLYCQEGYAGNNSDQTVDARGMSDGTLRFLAILTALLTRPSQSLLIIEEVDNGLHPSRSELLLKMLRDVGLKRKIDVMVTTHNPALLDAMGTEMVPFITVSHRDARDGSTRLTLLEEVERLPKLLAQGLVGRLSAKGLVEEALLDQGMES